MKRLSFLILVIFLDLAGCVEKSEEPLSSGIADYLPLNIGNYWIYQTDEIVYYGENDSEEASYLTRDWIWSSYLNSANELVYVVERSKSDDGESWVKLLDYTLLVRNNTLVKMMNNQAVVSLVYPATLGTSWNGRIYQAGGEDSFEIVLSQNDLLRVDQEDLDDEVTIRDIRYEVYQLGVGLVADYKEVLTYCSRNDCLGQRIIEGGSKYDFKLVSHGKY